MSKEVKNMFDEVVEKMEEFNSARKTLEDALQSVETNLEELNKLRDQILKMLGETAEATADEPEKPSAPAKKTPAKKTAPKKQSPKAVVAPVEDAAPADEDDTAAEAVSPEEDAPAEEPTPAEEPAADDSDVSDDMEDLFVDDSKDSSEKKSTSTVDVSDEVEDDFDNIQF